MEHPVKAPPIPPEGPPHGPPEGPPHGPPECPPEGPPHGPHEGPPHGPPPRPPRRGRLAGYFVCMVVMNILLAFYALYALGLVMQFDWYRSADSVSVLQVVWMVILAFSPLLLTILFNRLLYLLFRGRRRFFPRGTVFLVVLVLIAVQALTVMLTLRYGLVEGATGLGMGDYISFFSEITT